MERYDSSESKLDHFNIPKLLGSAIAVEFFTSFETSQQVLQRGLD